MGWWAEQLAVGLELGMEREVEVTGELRLFIGIMLLKPPLVLLAYILSSMSKEEKTCKGILSSLELPYLL